MKVKIRYRQYGIEAVSVSRGEGQGWTCLGSLYRSHAAGVDGNSFQAPGTLNSEEAAIHSTLETGRRLVDAGFDPGPIYQ